MSIRVRLCSMVLSVIVLITAVCGLELNVSAENTVGIINGTKIFLRTHPTTESPSTILGRLNYPEEVTILETVEGNEPSSEQGQGTTWYHVSTSSGATGYVYGRYVTIKTPPPIVPNENFEEQLALFPESYHASLRALHEQHPNWVFVADKLTMSFDEAVSNEYNLVRKYVELSQGIAWRSLQGDFDGRGKIYNWETDTWRILDGSSWTAASKEVVAYYMDPRNFLDNTYVYMFMKQAYDSNYQTEQGLAAVLNGTFLANGYTPDANNPTDMLYGGSYSKVLMAAAQASGVSPYVLAAKIIAEQGSNGTSSLISGTKPGYEGYYNFYNWGAYGADVVTAGLQTAKNNGWNSRATAIIEGAKKLADGYINDRQDTYYYMDFNVVRPSYYSHEYAAAAYDAYNKAYQLSKVYYGAYDSAPLVFTIPVYTSIPDSLATKPAVGDNRYNNYYLTSMSVDGLSPAFNMYTQNYTLSVSGDTTVYVKTPATASIVSAAQNTLSEGSNIVHITVRAETGYTSTYILNVTSSALCTLTVTTDDPTQQPPAPPTPPAPDPEPDPEPKPDPEPEPQPTVKKGDINGDGVINGIDLAGVRLHILEIRVLSGDELLAADINNDGAINGIDLAGVRLDILGIRPIN